MNWKSVNDDGAPPFDVLVLVKGPHPTVECFIYAIAYNDCYIPDICMIQVIHTSSGVDSLPVPFEVIEWKEIG